MLAFTREAPKAALLVLVAFDAERERGVRVELDCSQTEAHDLLSGTMARVDVIRIGGAVGAVRIFGLEGTF